MTKLKIKTQSVTKLFSLNCDKTQKLKFWKNSESKLWKTQKLKLLQNSTTQIVTKLKNLNWAKIQLKAWQISKTQTLAKFYNSNWDQTQQLKLWPKKRKKTWILIKRTICDNNVMLTTDEVYLRQPFAMSHCF